MTRMSKKHTKEYADRQALKTGLSRAAPGILVDLMTGQSKIINKDAERVNLGPDYIPQALKVQVPITTNAPRGDEMALVYNETRSVCFNIPIDQALLDYMRGQKKIYVVGHLDKLADGSDKFHIVRRIETQAW